MNDVILYLLLGLGIGSLYAMLGTGLVVVYRGSGVINFAHGAMAMYGVFTFDEARRNGDIYLPWVDVLPTTWLNIPVKIHLSDDGVGLAVAVGIALLMSVLIGLMIHFLVFRPLRNAAPLGKVIGSVGVMLYLQGVAQKHFGGTGRQPESVLPDEPLQNFLGLGSAYPRNALWAVVIALAIGGGLWALFRYTRFGLATRAAAGNEKGAVLLGYSPQFLAAMNWVIAAVVATISAIVVGPIQGSLTPIGLSSLVVVALGAALIGNLKSIMWVTVAGLGIGAVQSLLGFWSSKDWFPEFLRAGVREAVPLVVIALVLFLRGKNLPIRGTVEEKRLPLSPRPVRVIPHTIVWSIVVIAAAFLFEDSGSKTVFAFALSTSLIAAIVMLSMVVLTGYVGQISLAQMSLAGVSAFFMARMMADGSTTATNPFPVDGPGLPWPVAAILGVLVAIVVGVLLGLPAVRIRGVQLAVVTLAFAISLQTLYLDNQSLTDISAGAPASVKPASIFGISLASTGDKGLQDRPAFTIFVLVVLVVCALAVANLRRNGTGRRFLAVRANERAAAAAGINVARTKLLAFGIAAGIAGIGGVMLGFKQNDVSSAGFVYQASLVFLAFAYLGGITSINGAIVGGLLAPAGLITVVSNYFFREADITSYIAIIGGASLVFTAVVHPEGIAPFFQPMFQYFGRWLVRARGAEWAAVAKRLGPVALLGAVLGALVWPVRVDSYSWFWMPLLGAFLALFIRSIVMRIVAARRGEGGHGHGHGHGPVAEPAVTKLETV
jgi:branched-subunit amino acid ABC-type transport system permease component